MGRALSLSWAVVAVFVLAGCDQKQAKSTTTFDASDPKNAPEPVRFGAKEQPAWQAGPEPESTPAIKALQTAASPAPQTEGDPAGKKLFDGARVTQASFTPPAKANGPAPVVVSNRKMSIDTDGRIKDPAVARQVKSRDRWHQDDTAYHYAGGAPLDATTTPYIVLPLDFHGAQMGDLALVEYNGRKVWAVCGDRGPAGQFGEASPAVAEALGINPDGRSGGVSRGVTYTVFPGSHGARPRDETQLAAFIDSSAPVLLARLNGGAPTMLASGVTSSSL